MAKLSLWDIPTSGPAQDWELEAAQSGIRPRPDLDIPMREGFAEDDTRGDAMQYLNDILLRAAYDPSPGVSEMANLALAGGRSGSLGATGGKRLVKDALANPPDPGMMMGNALGPDRNLSRPGIIDQVRPKTPRKSATTARRDIVSRMSADPVFGRYFNQEPSEPGPPPEPMGPPIDLMMPRAPSPSEYVPGTVWGDPIAPYEYQPNEPDLGAAAGARSFLQEEVGKRDLLQEALDNMLRRREGPAPSAVPSTEVFSGSRRIR